ncbi:MAG: phosphonate metabolism protein/1,5-bisphosphokinase (PRPP-forming) PhnN [Deltaproteobacteria bacterium]|jgi:ribose 1,5-bisphosphokinase|nr:phosphonate metabolism protein/1,5-bisphosphokinase (PRPP-forming) PhnN [Deltaproteobacteria bacterium]
MDSPLESEVKHAGRLIYVIGPSGAGKDSVLREVKAALGDRVKVMRRYITRKDNEAGEGHYYVTDDEFERMKKSGMFSLNWESHGLKYGVGKEMEDELYLGNTVIVNGSREYLKKASSLFQRMEVIEIMAELPIIKRRLLTRKREAKEEIEERIERGWKRFEIPEHVDYTKIDNSGNLETAVNKIIQLLKPFK